MRRAGWVLILLALYSGPWFAQDARTTGAAHPGSRVLLDAHNCYPYDGRWADRIDRALRAGFPLSIEQDLAW